MSQTSTREYPNQMRKRYRQATSKVQKSHIVDEVITLKGYNRKYAIRLLNQSEQHQSKPIRRPRSVRYREVLPVIQAVWQALDYPCAERLHPVLLQTAQQLHKHIDRYAWNEDKPGALEVDLVERNGGSSTGHYAYTIDLVDVVSFYSRRRAVLGRGQAGVHREIELMISEWPFLPWGLHSDNGSEFLSDQLNRYCKSHQLKPSRGSPYRKNDQPHVEQKNRQFVRNAVGYRRYDTPEKVAWLNEVYGVLDLYANLFIPSRKVIAKERVGSRTKKTYDEAKTPVQRLLRLNVLDDLMKERLKRLYEQTNPAALQRELERLISAGPRETAITPIEATF